MTYSRPKPPTDQGRWTLLQSRIERSFWQWDRETTRGNFTHFVILRGSDRYEYDTFDKAEQLFFTLDGEDSMAPQPERAF